ncbi:MAG: hypothetical protein KF797_12150 [Flavobacteriales bacterium]|nr:hypothetical protein [Flavobacteriales bacterium]
MKRNLLIGLAVLVTSIGCRKDDLNVADLNTNPFDADYAGPAIFEKVAERTVPYEIDSVIYQRLEVDVRVNTSGLPTSGGYGVRYRAQHWSSGVNVPPADLADGLFTLSVLDVTPGLNYCVEVRLTNGGGAGGGNTLCATAE